VVGVGYPSVRKSKRKFRQRYKLNQGRKIFWLSLSVREKIRYWVGGENLLGPRPAWQI